MRDSYKRRMQQVEVERRVPHKYCGGESGVPRGKIDCSPAAHETITEPWQSWPPADAFITCYQLLKKNKKLHIAARAAFKAAQTIVSKWTFKVSNWLRCSHKPRYEVRFWKNVCWWHLLLIVWKSETEERNSPQLTSVRQFAYNVVSVHFPMMLGYENIQMTMNSWWKI